MGWLDDDTTAFVESGCALILGSVGPGGEPCASRGWGLTVLPEPGHVRLLIDGEDHTTLGNLAAGAPVAITAASIRTLQSIQMKGHVATNDEIVPEDLLCAERYCEALFSDIHETDLTARSLLEELRPLRLAACTAVIEERFDQTPGPGAGARVAEP